MAGISNAMANNVLDAIFGQGYTKPATVYVALTTSLATATDTGSTIVEPTSAQFSGYARAAVTNDATHWPNASGGSKTNGLPITFPASAGGASAPVTAVGWAICDASSGGVLIAFGALTSTISIGSGVEPQFNAGALAISES